MIIKLSQKINSLLLAAKKYRSHQRSNLEFGALLLGQPAILASVVVTALVLGIRQIGSLQPLEMVAFDYLVRSQPDPGSDPRLLVVAITESDIQEIERLPLPDGVVAQVLEKLQQYQPRVIGLDLYRDISYPPGHEALVKQLQADNVIAITKIDDSDNQGVLPPPSVLPEHIGFNDFVIDPDGVIRRNLMFALEGEEEYYSFALRLSIKYLAEQNISFSDKYNYLQLGQTKFVPLEAHSGGYQTIDPVGYQVLFNYRSKNEVARQVTLKQVLQGEINPAWVKDKVVLIGTTAPSMKDLFLTPYSSVGDKPLMSGVIIHAQMTSQILSTVLDEQPLFWFWTQRGEFLWIWSWSLVGGIIAWRLKHPLSLGLALLIASGGLVGICFVLFTMAGWIPLVPPAIALILTSGSVIAYKGLYDAFHDTLTGLPNRALFVKQLKQVLASTKQHEGVSYAVLFLDLDRFKVINDSIGQQAGDQVLIMTVSRLKNCLRSCDLVARVGGDEFAILMKHISDVSEAVSMAERLQKQLTLPFKINEQEIFTSISIGIAFNQTEYNYQPEDLLRDAHTAMYRAKIQGKNRFEVFATGMHTQAVKRFQLETDLRQAIKNREFLLYYQPIVDLQTGLIAGFEALIRWQHPQRGMVSPFEFISVAEETGLIIPLGQWILQEACQQMCIWHKQFPQESTLDGKCKYFQSAVYSTRFSRTDSTNATINWVRWLQLKIRNYRKYGDGKCRIGDRFTQTPKSSQSPTEH